MRGSAAALGTRNILDDYLDYLPLYWLEPKRLVQRIVMRVLRLMYHGQNQHLTDSAPQPSKAYYVEKVASFMRDGAVKFILDGSDKDVLRDMLKHHPGFSHGKNNPNYRIVLLKRTREFFDETPMEDVVPLLESDSLRILHKRLRLPPLPEDAAREVLIDVILRAAFKAGVFAFFEGFTVTVLIRFLGAADMDTSNTYSRYHIVVALLSGLEPPITLLTGRLPPVDSGASVISPETYAAAAAIHTLRTHRPSLPLLSSELLEEALAAEKRAEAAVVAIQQQAPVSSADVEAEQTLESSSMSHVASSSSQLSQSTTSGGGAPSSSSAAAFLQQSADSALPESTSSLDVSKGQTLRRSSRSHVLVLSASTSLEALKRLPNSHLQAWLAARGFCADGTDRFDLLLRVLAALRMGDDEDVQSVLRRAFGGHRRPRLFLRPGDAQAGLEYARAQAAKSKGFRRPGAAAFGSTYVEEPTEQESEADVEISEGENSPALGADDASAVAHNPRKRGRTDSGPKNPALLPATESASYSTGSNTGTHAAVLEEIEIDLHNLAAYPRSVLEAYCRAEHIPIPLNATKDAVIDCILSHNDKDLMELYLDQLESYSLDTLQRYCDVENLDVRGLSRLDMIRAIRQYSLAQVD